MTTHGQPFGPGDSLAVSTERHWHELTMMGNNILLLRKKAPEKIGSLFIPDVAQEKLCEGEVLAVGPGRARAKDGRLEPMAVRVGDKVVIDKYAGVEVQCIVAMGPPPEWGPLTIVSEDNVIGILE